MFFLLILLDVRRIREAQKHYGSLSAFSNDPCLTSAGLTLIYTYLFIRLIFNLQFARPSFLEKKRKQVLLLVLCPACCMLRVSIYYLSFLFCLVSCMLGMLSMSRFATLTIHFGGKQHRPLGKGQSLQLLSFIYGLLRFILNLFTTLRKLIGHVLLFC
jgi:hypothetical protein